MAYPRGDLILFWRPNNAGYTAVVDDAGRYTITQIKSDEDYYNRLCEKEERIAVPVSAVMPFTRTVITLYSATIAKFRESAEKAKIERNRPSTS